MKSRRLSFIAAIFFVLILLLGCKSEQIILHGELNGTVADALTSNPVNNASVILNPVADTVYTGQEGKYFFGSLPPGNYDLKVSKENYFPLKENVSIYSGTTQSADFKLEETPSCKISVPYLDFGFDSTIKRFTITNTGIGKLYYLAVSDVDWITLTSYLGSGFLTNHSDTITVRINRAGLSPDKHKELIILWSNSGGSWLPDSIYVFLNGVIDQDLNIYNVVRIGDQTWMSENLNVGKFAEGSNSNYYSSLIKKHCYDDNVENCKIYGGLYDWQELMRSGVFDNGITGTTRGICPAGWHIPSFPELNKLIDYLGGTGEAGGKMKESGTLHWAQTNIATNESGFTALPGGAYFYNNFSGIENTAYFWSSSHKINGDSYSNISYKIIGSDASINAEEMDYLYSFSVRCIQDPPKK
jgi:uncharacterized protein (TIGR02145 family)